MGPLARAPASRSSGWLVSTGILLLVAVCGWLVGAFAIVGGWVGIEWAWLQSPLAHLFGL